MIEEPVIGFKLLNMESHNTPLLSIDYNIIILISPPRARALTFHYLTPTKQLLLLL